MAGEMVLYYSPEKNEKTRRVKSALVRLGIRIKNIAPEDTSEQIGTLAGASSFPGKRPKEETPKSGTAAEIPEEVLVLCNFSGKSLDRLLKELRRSGAQIPLKAVLTDTNISWTFCELYQEVEKERKAMEQAK